MERTLIFLALGLLSYTANAQTSEPTSFPTLAPTFGDPVIQNASGYIVHQSYAPNDTSCGATLPSNGLEYPVFAFGYPVGICIPSSEENEFAYSDRYVYAYDPSNPSTVFLYDDYYPTTRNCTGNVSESLEYSVSSICHNVQNTGIYGYGFITSFLEPYNTYQYKGGVVLTYQTMEDCLSNFYPTWNYVVSDACINGVFLTCNDDTFTVIEYGDSTCSAGDITSYKVFDINEKCIAVYNDASEITGYMTHNCTGVVSISNQPTPIPVSAPTAIPSGSSGSSKKFPVGPVVGSVVAVVALVLAFFLGFYFKSSFIPTQALASKDTVQNPVYEMRDSEK